MLNSQRFLNLFLPHPQTHQKAHLISTKSLFIYLMLFLLLRAGFDLISFYKPGVLGINSNITAENIIDETNREREKKGLPPVKLNPALTTAAVAKARNMFEENYWAHFAPSGKDPWSFILSSGYKFSYAGENLARNFSNSEEVVTAWMNSPSHKDNLLSPNYEDIGIAVVDGVLNGQKTTLVVQMFGKSYQPIASLPQVDLGGQKISITPAEVEKDRPVLIAGVSKPIASALVAPNQVLRTVAISLMVLVASLTLLDFVVLKRRGVFRLSSHHLSHLSLLTIAATAIFLAKVGEIL